jgi:hypothetical protein
MNLLERAGNDGQTYSYENNQGADLVQYQFVMWVNDPDAVSFNICGYVPDEDGIEDGEEGNIRTAVGDVWQISQIDASFAAGEKYDAVFMTPGGTTFHAVRVAGDYEVGFLSEDVGDGDNYIKVQFTPPQISVA